MLHLNPPAEELGKLIVFDSNGKSQWLPHIDRVRDDHVIPWVQQSPRSSSFGINQDGIYFAKTADPDAPKEVNGQTVVNFSAAHNSGDGNKTLFFRGASWNGFGPHLARDAKKGDAIFVSGKLSIREWTGDDGKTRTELCVRANEVRLLQKMKRPEEAETPF